MGFDRVSQAEEKKKTEQNLVTWVYEYMLNTNYMLIDACEAYAYSSFRVENGFCSKRSRDTDDGG